MRTIPSIATWLMDAESIKKLLNVEPSYWQNLDEESLFCAQTEAHSLLAQIFLSYEDDEKQREILKAIVEDDFGLLYLSYLLLAMIFLNWNMMKNKYLAALKSYF